MGSCTVELVNVTKYFGDELILQNVSCALPAASVVMLTGQNGAGKSTLAEMIAGAFAPDAGQILVDGQEVLFRAPADAQAKGIFMIHQQSSLINQMTVMENLFLNRLPRKKGYFGQFQIDHTGLVSDAEELLALLPIRLSPHTPARDLSLGQRQLVEILRAYNNNSQLLILDEPTMYLNEPESALLHELVARLKQRGVTILYITHTPEEVYTLGDYVMVLKDKSLGELLPLEGVEEGVLFEQLTGKTYRERYPKIKSEIGNVLLELERVSTENSLEEVSFSVKEGEIVGIYGSSGSGRSSIARVLYGLEKTTAGRIIYQGKVSSFKQPIDAIKRGICYIPEDADLLGIFPNLDSGENISMATMSRIWNGVFLDRYRQYKAAELYSLELGFPIDLKKPAGMLSGGTKQKILLARWLFKESKVFLLDEPTRGLDVSTKVDIYNIINHLVLRKVSVLLISSNLQELLGMSDRILVIDKGRIVAELENNGDLTQELVLSTLIKPDSR